MFIEQFAIQKFRILKDITINFQLPKSATAHPETGNIVNILAGVNGSGKTSLLEAIFLAISRPITFHEGAESPNNIDSLLGTVLLSDMGQINKSNWGVLHHKVEALKKKNEDSYDFYETPRIILLPSQQNFQYSSISQLELKYAFAQRVNTRNIIGQAEFYIKEFILNKERESTISSPVERTKTAVEAFNAHFLDTKLLTKLVDLSKPMFNRPVFENVSGDQVTIDKLSDGEKQLYGRLIALMILEPRNSIILIDEPEIALHPAWQQHIMQLYSRIGNNNQFIVATHSPQIIASVPYQNRILLRKEKNKIVPIHCQQPPSGVDVNSILSEIMGADSRSPQTEALYQTYRQLCRNSSRE